MHIPQFPLLYESESQPGSDASFPTPETSFSTGSSDDIDMDFDLDDFGMYKTMEEDSGYLDLDLDHEVQAGTDKDIDIHSSASEASSDGDEDNIPHTVVQKIEELALLFLRQLAIPGYSIAAESDSSGMSETSERQLSRADYKIELTLADRRKEDIDGICGTKVLRYPKKCNTGSAKGFAQLFKVLDLAHEAKLSGVPMTKRDIYYRDVSLFKTQKVVDSLVDDIAATFMLERSDLNIRSSSKGLICGSGLSITLLSGEVICCNDTEGSLIPAGEDVEAFSVDDTVAWVLLVEKEAVFQTLCRLQICTNKSLPGPGILITGKGYPDVATRHIVKSLSDALPRRIPVMALVDGDPYGLDILSVYKYGSRGMQHENDKLAARRIKWLGIWASELERLHRLGIKKDDLLPITLHDQKKAYSILRHRNTPLPRRWIKELQHMLHSRRKAEIEVLSGMRSEAIGIFEQNNILDGSVTPQETTYNPHGLLIQYLTSKISDCVASASSHKTES